MMDKTNMAKMAIGHLLGKNRLSSLSHFGMRTLQAYNSDISFSFHFEKNYIIKISSPRLVAYNQKVTLCLSISFGLMFDFCTPGRCWTYGLKTTIKISEHVLAILTNSYPSIFFSSNHQAWTHSNIIITGSLR